MHTATSIWRIAARFDVIACAFKSTQGMAVDLTFVNHASLIYEHGPVRLICDPWIEGTVFDNSWAHLSQSRFTYEDYREITHIWFSHEHPDHFFPPNVKKIPEEYRRKITVLFKHTLDEKVAAYCRNIGFKEVVELAPGERYELADDFSVICQPYHDDSALVVFAGGQTVVNANDCVLDTPEKLALLKSFTNGPVDVLLTQFSYASYVGETYEERRKHAEDKFREMSAQIETLAPKALIPFASFVYFCHEDNFHMNDAANRIDQVHLTLKAQGRTEPVVLYPGDRWRVGTPHASSSAIARYMADAEAITGPLVHTVSVTPEALMEAAGRFHGRLKEKVEYLPALKAFRVLRPLRLFVTDHNSAYELDLGALTPLTGMGKEGCGMAMSSQTLSFCLSFDYGWNTTAVNGKFQVLEPEALKSFRTLTSLGDAMNHGRVTWGQLFKGIQRRVSRRIGLTQKAA